MKSPKEFAQHYTGFITTPALWSGRTFFPYPQFQLPKSVYSELINQYSFKENILGKRVEELFNFCIVESNQYKVLANNTQISKNKITLGELDFVLEDIILNKQIHVEVVYKFYLYDNTLQNDELFKWIGPNRKDSLVKKLTKLRLSQFPLLYHSETKTTFNHLNINFSKIEQQVCFKANLFVHKKIFGNQFSYINNSCIAGWWIYYNELEKEIKKDCLFAIPRKTDWICSPENCDNWLTYTTFKESLISFLKIKKAPLCWIKRRNGTYTRFFVVWW